MHQETTEPTGHQQETHLEGAVGGPPDPNTTTQEEGQVIPAEGVPLEIQAQNGDHGHMEQDQRNPDGRSDTPSSNAASGRNPEERA